MDALGLEISTPLPPNEVFANLVENCTRITEPFFLSKIKGENTGERCTPNPPNVPYRAEKHPSAFARTYKCDPD